MIALDLSEAGNIIRDGFTFYMIILKIVLRRIVIDHLNKCTVNVNVSLNFESNYYTDTQFSTISPLTKELM